MIDRYWGKDMKALSTDEAKFQAWLEVERAVLEARERLGQIPAGTTGLVMNSTWMDEAVAEAIVKRDKVIGHDLNAFLEIIRLQIDMEREAFLVLIAIEDDEAFNDAVDAALAAHTGSAECRALHEGMTSYDTEEPAMALLLGRMCGVISAQARALLAVLRSRAFQHKGVLMVGRSHGQHAQPITLGIKFVGYYEAVTRRLEMFEMAVEEVMVMKLSGAVGVYGTLGPEVEDEVGQILGLAPAVATQILPLDRRAAVVTQLSLLAAVVEKVARDLWLLSQTEIGEVREGFGKRQKGSSAMPHKKNPVLLENILGCARLVRAYATALVENIATANERDISHSAVERLALVDAFGIVDHMLRRLTGVLASLEVFPERMLQNLDATYGCLASQKVETILKAHGMPAEAAYRAVQRLCAKAMEEEVPLNVLLRSDGADDQDLAPYIRDAVILALDAAFDWAAWVQHEDRVFALAGLGDTA